MLLRAGADAAPLAALLSDRDPLPRGAPVDLTLRIEAITDFKRYTDTRPHPANRAAVERIKLEAKRLASTAGNGTTGPLSTAEQAALAYPDRIGQRRKGDAARFILSGGKGAILDDHDPLANARLIVATDLDGNPREAKIRQAAAITERALRELFADQIGWQDICEWSRRDRRVITRKQERFGALVLDDRIWSDAPPDQIARAMLDGVHDLGLSPSAAAERFRARVTLARKGGLDLPDMSDPALMETLEDWLLPHLHGVRTAADWKAFDLLAPLRAMLDWDSQQQLDRAVPAHFTSPLGRQIPIDYGSEVPSIELRLQEMFGVAIHPTVGQARKPLRVTLLSPGQKPIKVTLDIPNFWRTSYTDVRKDMRGQYPRHPWPEDPTEAEPTLRAKPRGT
jgi:ATP-dependent helicase HrpB